MKLTLLDKFTIGITWPFQLFRFLQSERKYFRTLWPGLILTVLLFPLLVVGLLTMIDLTVYFHLPSVGWLATLIFTLTNLSIFLLLFLLAGDLFALLGFIIIFPLLSKPVSNLLRKGLDSEIVESTFWVEIKKILLLIPVLLLLLGISLLKFLPGIGIFIHLLLLPIWAIFAASMAFELPLSLLGGGAREQFFYPFRHFAFTLPFGLVIYLISLFPVINFLTFPFAVTMATLFCLKERGVSIEEISFSALPTITDRENF